MSSGLDFRSDASSAPTPAMRQAMAAAPVGNDDFGDDPTVNELESEGARILGKEAALFVHSATMANLAAVMSHVDAGGTVLTGERFHVFDHEGDAMGRVAGVDFTLVPDETCRGRTRLPLERLPADSESVGLLSLENSVSRPGGTVIDMEHLQQLSGWARERGLPVHLDGARLLNACIELHVEAPTMAACADSVSLALTKGLSAPCGALLAGPAEFVERARRHRWMLGGNWKQGGVVAAACLTALTSMPERLRLDHDHARRLAEGLNSIEGLAVDVDEVVTNILYMATDSGFDAVRWCELVARAGVTVGPFGSDGRCRWVTHPGLTTSDIDRAIHVAASAAQRTRTCTD